MKVVKCESIYSPEVVFDIPRFEVMSTSGTPLYIAAKLGQKLRVEELYMGRVKVVGLWELNKEGYLGVDGEADLSKFLAHPVVLVADASRVPEAVRAGYKNLISMLEAA